MRRLSAALVLILCAPVLSAQVYKWVDANGTTHYAATPPDKGSYQRINTAGVAVSTPAPPAAPAAPASAAAPVADTPANRALLCADLARNLELLKGKGPLNLDNGKSGGTPMSDDRRAQELSTAQAQYQQYCAK